MLKLFDPQYDEFLNSDVYTHTIAGRMYLSAPEFNIEAMAHALGQNARYTGNGRFRYSVAEHSVLVSLLMEELKLGDPLEGLLHDGTESILADIASPYKHILGDYKKVERYLDLHIRNQFGLEEDPTDGMKLADALALFIEAYQLIDERGADFEDPLRARPQALRLISQGWRIKGLNDVEAKQAFLERYHYLVKNRVIPIEIARQAKSAEGR